MLKNAVPIENSANICCAVHHKWISLIYSNTWGRSRMWHLPRRTAISLLCPSRALAQWWEPSSWRASMWSSIERGSASASPSAPVTVRRGRVKKYAFRSALLFCVSRNVCHYSLLCSARRVPHNPGERPVPRRWPGRLRLQHTSDGRVHADDHRLHHGGNLRPLHAAAVSHGVPVALRPLPTPTGGLCWWYVPPEMTQLQKPGDWVDRGEEDVHFYSTLVLLKWIVQRRCIWRNSYTELYPNLGALEDIKSHY